MRIASMQVQNVAAARAKPPAETMRAYVRAVPARGAEVGSPRLMVFALFVERSRGGREGAKQGTFADYKLLVLRIE